MYTHLHLNMSVQTSGCLCTVYPRAVPIMVCAEGKTCPPKVHFPHGEHPRSRGCPVTGRAALGGLFFPSSVMHQHFPKGFFSPWATSLQQDIRVLLSQGFQSAPLPLPLPPRRASPVPPAPGWPSHLCPSAPPPALALFPTPCPTAPLLPRASSSCAHPSLPLSAVFSCRCFSCSVQRRPLHPPPHTRAPSSS